LGPLSLDGKGASKFPKRSTGASSLQPAGCTGKAGGEKKQTKSACRADSSSFSQGGRLRGAGGSRLRTWGGARDPNGGKRHSFLVGVIGCLFPGGVARDLSGTWSIQGFQRITLREASGRTFVIGPHNPGELATRETSQGVDPDQQQNTNRRRRPASARLSIRCSVHLWMLSQPGCFLRGQPRPGPLERNSCRAEWAHIDPMAAQLKNSGRRVRHCRHKKAQAAKRCGFSQTQSLARRRPGVSQNKRGLTEARARAHKNRPDWRRMAEV